MMHGCLLAERGGTEDGDAGMPRGEFVRSIIEQQNTCQSLGSYTERTLEIPGAALSVSIGK